MPKNLIFCFDGTMYDPDNWGNIWRLHQLFSAYPEENDNLYPNPNNFSFYWSGVGTRQAPWRPLRRLLSAVWASSRCDVADIINEAGATLRENYQEGDKVYLFGWSRGAAIARRFAAVNYQYMLPERGGVPIELLLCIDTVASVDGPLLTASDVRFTNGNTVAYGVKQAVHLVSLHEDAAALTPTLMNRNPRVAEVWLPGGHADLGGANGPLSDLTLDFITSYLDTSHSALGVRQTFAPAPRTVYTPAKKSKLRLLGQEQRFAGVLEDGKPNHQLPILLSQEAVNRARGQRDEAFNFFWDFPESLHHLPTYTPVSGGTLRWWPVEYLETEDLLL